MNIITWNLNGIKAVWKHVLPFVEGELHADVFCFQETKLRSPSAYYRIPGYWGFFSCAHSKKGYSGTAVFTRILPLRISYSMTTKASAFIEIHGPEHARQGVLISENYKDEQDKWEGRIITMDFPGFFLVNAYVPNPLRNRIRLSYRKKWDSTFYGYIEELEKIKPTIVCGDFNLVARNEDSHSMVKLPIQNNVALMSRERALYFHAIENHFVDAYRVKRPQETDCYTWWSNRINYREENKGARLDYFLVSKKMKDDIVDCVNMVDIYGSDHCPLRLAIDIVAGRYDRMKIESARKSIADFKRGELYPNLDLSFVWMCVDWEGAQNLVHDMQVRISECAKIGHFNDALGYGDIMMDSVYPKLLAVRHVAGSAPGIDHIEWNTAMDKMKAVQALDRNNYKAYPYRAFVMRSRYGKERLFGALTLYDRAMQTLMAMALDPIAEATGDNYSFAFRKGRCALDAAEYLRDILQKCCGGDKPYKWVVKVDVRQFYASISHEWIRRHIPLDKHLMEEMLEQGYVMDGELFPPKGTGVCAGMQLSPIIGNMVLDGLQQAVYDGIKAVKEERELKKEEKQREVIKVDPNNGKMIRYADDAVFLAKTKDDARIIMKVVHIFLKERGLEFNDHKTMICKIKDGFTFMQREYSMDGSLVVIKTTRQAIDTFKMNLEETVMDLNITQEELIPLLNKKLVAWANYHRLEDCISAFREIDIFLKTKLMQRCKKLHPRAATGTLKRKYFYPDEYDRWTYSLPGDRTTKVIYMSDITPAVHQRIPADYNPYELEILPKKEIQKARSINNVTGRYATLMRRHGGRCVICGKPILPDQEKEIAQAAIGYDMVLEDAYVHSRCATGATEAIFCEDIPVSSSQALYEIKSLKTNRVQRFIDYLPLEKFFSRVRENHFTLTFDKIRELNGRLTPNMKQKRFWLNTGDGCVSNIWMQYGFVVTDFSQTKEEVTFTRAHYRTSRIPIPEWMYRADLPDGLCDEVGKFIKYVEKKYGVR